MVEVDIKLLSFEIFLQYFFNLSFNIFDPFLILLTNLLKKYKVPNFQGSVFGGWSVACLVLTFYPAPNSQENTMEM